VGAGVVGKEYSVSCLWVGLVRWIGDVVEAHGALVWPEGGGLEEEAVDIVLMEMVVEVAGLAGA